MLPMPAPWRDEAEHWDTDDALPPAKSRWAVAVMLMRDGPDGVEVFLEYQTARSGLGAVTFVGAPLRENDTAPLPWTGPVAARWGQLLDVEDPELAQRLVCGAARVVFERAGILLGSSDGDRAAEVTSGPDGEQRRREVHDEERTLGDVLRRRALDLDTSLLRPLSRWISPAFLHKRLCTQYFAVVLPLGQEPAPLEGVTGWGRWCSPVELMADPASTALGDEIDQPDTVGRRVEDLVLPAVLIMLRKLANLSCTISYISEKRPSRQFEPVLVTEDGTPMLRVDGLPAPARPVVHSL
ncbi:NUDIX hydrolase [Tersicoccus sp. Bi-70]|uniref:NUDIX hydrolase n=1 Tax=Tersicoccus sp. Bi-70 TaxID=1897634 RepID=UPI00117F4EFB|nr:NUDIX hydrolase [Tersicoccus sp. Bi-70]